MMTPRLTPHPDRPATFQRQSRTITIGVITLVIQFIALVFFIGQFFERQQTLDEAMKRVIVQNETVIADLAVLKQSQLEQDRRLDKLEETELEEGHPQYRGK